MMTFSITFGTALSHREPRGTSTSPLCHNPTAPPPCAVRCSAVQCSAGAAKALQCSAAGLSSVCSFCCFFFLLHIFFSFCFLSIRGKAGGEGGSSLTPPLLCPPCIPFAPISPHLWPKSKWGYSIGSTAGLSPPPCKPPWRSPWDSPMPAQGSTVLHPAALWAQGNPSGDPFITPIPTQGFNPQSPREKKGDQGFPCATTPGHSSTTVPHCPWQGIYGGEGMGIYGPEEGWGCSHPYRSFPGQSRIHGQEVGAARGHRDENQGEVWGTHGRTENGG